jgi:hypothetical protein
MIKRKEDKLFDPGWDSNRLLHNAKKRVETFCSKFKFLAILVLSESNKAKYCSRGKSVRFAYVTRLRVVRKQMRFLTCGPRTPGGPRLFRKLNNLSQQINKVHVRKKAKSETENTKTLCKSEGI